MPSESRLPLPQLQTATLAAAAAFAVTVATAALQPAQAADPAPAAAADAKPSDDPVDLTPEEKAEKEGRKACKIDICSAMHDKQASGGNIACKVVKSWRKEQLTKLVSKLKVSWPYGPVRCDADIHLDRAALVKAVSDPKAELQLEKHAVSCDVQRDGKEPTHLNIEFSPKVTFENGKAVSAQMNWGKLEAPTLMKTLLWPATGADNKINMLSGMLVEDINNFISKKCVDVKDEK